MTPISSKRRSLKSLLAALAASACLALVPGTASASIYTRIGTGLAGLHAAPSAGAAGTAQPFADDVGAPPGPL